MDVRGEKFLRVKELLKELDLLENAVDVRSNSDSKIRVVFTSEFNHGEKERKEASIELPQEEAARIVSYILKRQATIIAELEQM